MDIPKGFVKKPTKESIEKILSETVIKGVLIKDLAKELKTCLENELIAKRLTLSFQKNVYLTKDKNYTKTITREVRSQNGFFHDIEKKLPLLIKPVEVYDNIRANKTYPLEKEIHQILEGIKDLEPDLKEEEIEYTNSSIDILSEDFIYQLYIHIHEETERVKTNKTIEVGRAFKRIVPIIKLQYYPQIRGDVSYAKFDKKHHKKIVQVLRENGYDVQVIIK